jgi:hypothetical protein
MFIEANDQTEGVYAAITSSDTGCGLSIDYHMYGGGIGTLTVSAKNAADGDGAAWVPVWTKEGDQGNSWQATTAYLASSSYYRVTATRGGGNRGDIAIDNMNLVACTLAPTLAPTNAGELPICNFNVGFCAWTQDADDNFDWVLTSDSTPTSNTGPSDGAGHGGGAFIHIEANDQTEDAYAAITSSNTGCGLYVDYHMYGGGIGTLTVSAKNAVDGDDAAWVPVWTKEGTQGDSWQAATIISASGSYYRVTAVRGGGNRGDIAVDNLNLIWCTEAPTATPTNEGDTHSPTASPTAVPTASPTIAPTSAPTSMPTATPTFSPASNWNQLSNKCGTSACNTANGGCTITLSDDFIMGSYTYTGAGQGDSGIDFSGKAITIWGQEKVLDAAEGGRFFKGNGAGSFLELHNAVLQNGHPGNYDGGGAINAENGANVEIHDSTIQSNTAPEYSGGALLMHQGTMEIYDSTFESNACAGSSIGGAIRVYGGVNLEVYDSEFINNLADSGGAISTSYFQGNDVVEIHDSTFRANWHNAIFISGNENGAIGSSNILKIYTSTFESNTAELVSTRVVPSWSSIVVWVFLTLEPPFSVSAGDMQLLKGRRSYSC